MIGAAQFVRGLAAVVATVWLAAAPGACGGGGGVTDAVIEHPEDTAAVPASRVIAFVGVNVVSMRTSTIDRDQTVIVRDRRIATIGPEGSTTVPEGAFIVNAGGAYLMPGLVDMHVHNAVRDGLLYVPHGITMVRNLWGFPGLREYAARVINEDLRAPTIITISPGLDGHPARWPYTRFADNVSTAGDTVRTVLAEGWSAIKIYDGLPRASFDSILTIAHARGVRVIGHVPFAIPVQYALTSGQDEIEHLSGYDRALGGGGWGSINEGGIPALVTQTVAARTWNCPTLAIIAHMASGASQRDAIVRNRRRFVKALHDGGAKLLVGTDSGIDVVPAGSTIHTELSEFVAAGLTPYDALRAATYNAAESLGALNEFGTVEVGRRADLLLVDRNPLADVAHVRTFRGVVLRGAWIPRPLLDAAGSSRQTDR